MAKSTEALQEAEPAAEMVHPTPDPERKPTAKRPTKVSAAIHADMVWCHTAEFDETFEMFFEPDVWSHVARSMQPGHEIKVTAADGTWRGELYVRAVGRVEVVTGVISYVEFGSKTKIKDGVPYAAIWRGPSAMWSVINKTSKEVIKDHFQTKENAAGWIISHMQALEN